MITEKCGTVNLEMTLGIRLPNCTTSNARPCSFTCCFYQSSLMRCNLFAFYRRRFTKDYCPCPWFLLSIWKTFRWRDPRLYAIISHIIPALVRNCRGRITAEWTRIANCTRAGKRKETSSGESGGAWRDVVEACRSWCTSAHNPVVDVTY